MTTLGIDIGGSAVKVAALDGDRVVATAHGPRYQRPGLEQLVAAMRGAVAGVPGGAAGELVRSARCVGVCVPGIVDPRTRVVSVSVNVPGLNGVSLDRLVGEVLGENGEHGADGGAAARAVTFTSDARAAAHDAWIAAGRPGGRFMGISLGTGVGACVLDDGVPLKVSGESSGHFGQIDVTLNEGGRGAVPIGPDGGEGSLEAYAGLAALIGRYGPDVTATLARLSVGDAPVRALCRAIRIAHAIYRPQHVMLLGGVGIRLASLAPAMHERVSENLTRLARPSWTLAAGTSDFHAAQGVARLAGESKALGTGH